nr:PepSY domain-containing protein [Actinomycetota bacterium]
MNRRTKILIGAAALAGAAAAGTGIAVAAGGDDSEPSISGPALERASAAALRHTDGGGVTDTEVGGEDSHYEVEVTLADGNEVDVQLDEGFGVVERQPRP